MRPPVSEEAAQAEAALDRPWLQDDPWPKLLELEARDGGGRARSHEHGGGGVARQQRAHERQRGEALADRGAVYPQQVGGLGPCRHAERESAGDGLPPLGLVARRQRELSHRHVRGGEGCGASCHTGTHAVWRGVARERRVWAGGSRTTGATASPARQYRLSASGAAGPLGREWARRRAA